MAISESEVAATLFWLKLFFGVKAVGMFNGLISAGVIIYALKHIGTFFYPQLNPVVEDVLLFYVWGLPYTIPSYSDLMTYILLTQVGTDYDPSSPFLSIMFFILPVLLLVPRLALFTYNAATIDKLNFVSMAWALFYTVTPQLLATQLYYPLL